MIDEMLNKLENEIQAEILSTPFHRFVVFKLQLRELIEKLHYQYFGYKNQILSDLKATASELGKLPRAKTDSSCALVEGFVNLKLDRTLPEYGEKNPFEALTLEVEALIKKIQKQEALSGDPKPALSSSLLGIVSKWKKMGVLTRNMEKDVKPYLLEKIKAAKRRLPKPQNELRAPQEVFEILYDYLSASSDAASGDDISVLLCLADKAVSSARCDKKNGGEPLDGTTYRNSVRQIAFLRKNTLLAKRLKICKNRSAQKPSFGIASRFKKSEAELVLDALDWLKSELQGWSDEPVYTKWEAQRERLNSLLKYVDFQHGLHALDPEEELQHQGAIHMRALNEIIGNDELPQGVEVWFSEQKTKLAEISKIEPRQLFGSRVEHVRKSYLVFWKSFVCDFDMMLSKKFPNKISVKRKMKRRMHEALQYITCVEPVLPPWFEIYDKQALVQLLEKTIVIDSIEGSSDQIIINNLKKTILTSETPYQAAKAVDKVISQFSKSPANKPSRNEPFKYGIAATHFLNRYKTKCEYLCLLPRTDEGLFSQIERDFSIFANDRYQNSSGFVERHFREKSLRTLHGCFVSIQQNMLASGKEDGLLRMALFSVTDALSKIIVAEEKIHNSSISTRVMRFLGFSWNSKLIKELKKTQSEFNIAFSVRSFENCNKSHVIRAIRLILSHTQGGGEKSQMFLMLVEGLEDYIKNNVFDPGKASSVLSEFLSRINLCVSHEEYLICKTTFEKLAKQGRVSKLEEFNDEDTDLDEVFAVSMQGILDDSGRQEVFANKKYLTSAGYP